MINIGVKKYMLLDYETLVKMIIDGRNKLGISQRGLAQKAGVSQSVVGKLERGENVPNYKTIKAIYDAIEKEQGRERSTAEEFVEKDKKIVSVKPSDMVKDARRLMKENDFSQLPIEEEGEYTGLVTSTKLLDIEDKKVKIMQLSYSPLPTIPHKTPKEHFSDLLKTHQAVLVTQNREVIGMITAADLL